MARDRYLGAPNSRLLVGRLSRHPKAPSGQPPTAAAYMPAVVARELCSRICLCLLTSDVRRACLQHT